MEAMKFYIDTAGAIRHRPNGWPQEVFYRKIFGVPGIYSDDYERDLNKAKAESVPVKDQEKIYGKILWLHHPEPIAGIEWEPANDTLYEVPDEDIKPEWL